MRAIKDFGLTIPQDISVVGFDNSDIAPFLDPPLTSVAQPFYEMGAKACECLIQVIEGKREGKPISEVMPGQLVVRGSVV
jgi:LacI family transcriptional regulator